MGGDQAVENLAGICQRPAFGDGFADRLVKAGDQFVGGGADDDEAASVFLTDDAVPGLGRQGQLGPVTVEVSLNGKPPGAPDFESLGIGDVLPAEAGAAAMSIGSTCWATASGWWSKPASAGGGEAGCLGDGEAGWTAMRSQYSTSSG